MKKNIFLLLLSTILLTGCGGKKVEEKVDEIENAVEVITVQLDMDERLAKLPQSKEELFALSLEEFKAMINECIPNYREHFRVSEDYEINDLDWENFRTILSYELFRSAKIEEEVEATPDPNEIYYAPTEEYLNSLSQEEFVEYLSGLQKYIYPDIENVDYSLLTMEQLMQIKEQLLSGIQ